MGSARLIPIFCSRAPSVSVPSHGDYEILRTYIDVSWLISRPRTGGVCAGRRCHVEQPDTLVSYNRRSGPEKRDERSGLDCFDVQAARMRCSESHSSAEGDTDGSQSSSLSETDLSGYGLFTPVSVQVLSLDRSSLSHSGWSMP